MEIEGKIKKRLRPCKQVQIEKYVRVYVIGRIKSKLH